MDRVKRIILRMMFPPVLWQMILVPISAGMLYYIFKHTPVDTLTAYISYVLSFYTMTIIAVGLPHNIKKTVSAVKSHKLGSKLLTDIPFRVKVSLSLSFLVNILAAVLKLTAGVYYKSPWFITVAIYYILLCLMRLVLLRYLNGKNKTLYKELKNYRLCGYLLFGLNIPLSIMAGEIVLNNKGYAYSGMLIYAVAAYAFYSLIVTIVSLIRYRRYNNPVLSASKVINLASSLVAMFTLQTAMFASFGNGEKLQVTMNAITGICICFSIFIIAILMVLKANRLLKDSDHSQCTIEKRSW